MRDGFEVGLSIRLRSWAETDEHGQLWWHSQEVFIRTPDKAISPVFKSRVSRMRAESYVLAARAKELHDMEPL